VNEPPRGNGFSELIASTLFRNEPFGKDVEGLSRCYRKICDSTIEFHNRTGF
jgi:hypothetical protein